MTKERQSNLELLRIISMILILMSHCDDLFGLFDLYSTSLGINKIITDWLHIGGQIGVGCFLLISGYFMVEQNVSVKKILKLAGEVWFYTITIYLIWIISNICQKQINVKDCFIEAVYALFPILFSKYWFVTAYIILLLLSPFFNKLIYSLEIYAYQRFLGILLVVFVVLMGGIPIPGVLQYMTEGRLMPVFIMYFIAGYLRRFVNIKTGHSWRHFGVAFVLYFLLFVTFYCFTYLGILFDSEMIMNRRYFYRELNSPFVVLICIELFIGFLKLKIQYSSVINEIAGCTFAVYLLHSNRIMEEWLKTLFPIYKEKNSLLILGYSIIAVVLIYIMSTLIDWIRKKTIEPLWINFVNSQYAIVEKRVKKQ